MQRSHDELAARFAGLRPGGASVDESPAELAKRLQTMEAEQADLARTTRELDPYGLVATQEKELIDAYNTLLDKTQPAMARVKQVQQLKRFGYFDEAALQAATDLYSETDDLNERGFILDALKGSVPGESASRSSPI